MFRMEGAPGKTCAIRICGVNRRDVLRVGGSGLLGLSLGSMLKLQAQRASTPLVAPGWGKAKRIIMVYLQGGPSHLGFVGSKGNWYRTMCAAPLAIFRPRFQGSSSPRICRGWLRSTIALRMIRSMSYTPNGLFNHTAAIYQLMTGYTTDKVSPSGQLEPPSPKDFPNFRLEHRSACVRPMNPCCRLSCCRDPCRKAT